MKKQNNSEFKKKRLAWNKGLYEDRILERIKEKKNCEICKTEYGYKRIGTGWFLNKRFCSDKCRDEFFAGIPKKKKCLTCFNKFKDRFGGDKKYCSRNCYWSFLKNLHATENNKSNYVCITKNGRKTYEHRKVMEEFLGRKLKRNEIVHHKNGKKDDNRIENLQVINQSEHIREHFQKHKWGKN
ncbi:MAG: HNH endonuclease signature motif containing protein [Nanoarchaeota archaeon]